MSFQPGEALVFTPPNNWNHGIQTEPHTYKSKMGYAWLRMHPSDTTLTTVFTIYPKVFWDDDEAMLDAMDYVETIMKAIEEAHNKWEIKKARH